MNDDSPQLQNDQSPVTEVMEGSTRQRGAVAEFLVKQQLEAEGYKVYRGGCPDLLAIRANTPRFVEVKRPYSKLKSAQRRFHNALKSCGIQVDTFYVDYDGRVLPDSYRPPKCAKGKVKPRVERTPMHISRTFPGDAPFEARIAPKNCPHCGSDVIPFRRKDRRRIRRCRLCRHEYSILHGTPFANTKAPLGLWAAILENPKERMSILCRKFRVDEVTVSAIRKKAALVPADWKRTLLVGIRSKEV